MLEKGGSVGGSGVGVVGVEGESEEGVGEVLGVPMCERTDTIYLPHPQLTSQVKHCGTLQQK